MSIRTDAFARKKRTGWSRLGRHLRKIMKQAGGLISRTGRDPLLLRTEATGSSFAFYDEKSRDVPRFIYRRLYRDLEDLKESDRRRTVIDDFLKRIESEGSRGDFLKFKWVLPHYLRSSLGPEEFDRIEAAFSERRRKRNRRFMNVYPHCTDEFSMDPRFLEASVSATGKPVISRSTKVFTLGSCFARNIGVYLKSQGYNATVFPLAEDLNSPLSNAKMLAVAVADPVRQRQYLRAWLQTLSTHADAQVMERLLDEEVARLDDLVRSLRSADFLILTVGNVFDFFIEPDEGDIAPEIPVAPKFFGIAQSAEIAASASVASGLKSRGAKLRMANFSETIVSLQLLRRVIRSINPSACCAITLSPVPHDNAMGVEYALPTGSMELDCVSKSTLRAAMNEFFVSNAQSDPDLYYFPSFEIVRWIGGMLPIPNFGYEDSAARHVSSDILNGVYGLFLKKFGVEQEETSTHYL